MWELVFFSSLLIAIISLSMLFPTSLTMPLATWPTNTRKTRRRFPKNRWKSWAQEELIAILQSNLSRGAYNKLNNEKPMETRSRDELFNLVVERILQVKTRQTYTLWRSLTDRAGIEAEVKELYPDAKLEFRAWLTPRFLVTPQSSRAEFAGVRTGHSGFALDCHDCHAGCHAHRRGRSSVPARVCQQDQHRGAHHPDQHQQPGGRAFDCVRHVGAGNLRPHLRAVHQRAMFGVTDPNGRTVLSAGLTMGILVLPLVIINAQEAIKAVPDPIRQAAYGSAHPLADGVHHVLPNGAAGHSHPAAFWRCRAPSARLRR